MAAAQHEVMVTVYVSALETMPRVDALAANHVTRVTLVSTNFLGTKGFRLQLMRTTTRKCGPRIPTLWKSIRQSLSRQWSQSRTSHPGERLEKPGMSMISKLRF